MRTRNQEPVQDTTESLQGRTRMVGLQFQKRCFRPQHALPISNVLTERFVFQGLMLPKCEVAVLNREFGKRRRTIGGECLIQDGQLLEEYAIYRDAVKNQLVRGHVQTIFGIIQSYEPDS